MTIVRPNLLLIIILLAAFLLPSLTLAQGPEEAGLTTGGNVGELIGTVVGGPLGGISGRAIGGLGSRALVDFATIFDGLMAVAGKGIIFIVFTVNYFLGFVGGIAFALGGFLLQIGLELNSRLILSPVVQVGWQITRDFANLGFVIAIIVIAFATMLRLETYGMKKMLASLIIVALLVNFSLAFAGVFIDATGIVSNFFIRQVSPSGFGGIGVFAENLASVFQLQKLHEVVDFSKLPKFGSFGEFSASMLGLLASVFFIALFTVIGATVMLIIATLVIVRYIALALLLILMPLAMVAYIFPNLRGNWEKWLNNFTKWLVFLPVTLFFLYLTILIVTNFSDSPDSVIRIIAAAKAGNGGFFDQFLLTIANVLQIFAQMTVILGLLIGGLIAANSFSLQFAKAITSSVESGRNWLLDKTGRAAAAPGRWAGRELGRRALESKAAKGIVSGLTRFPGLRRAGSALAGRIASSKELSGEEVKKYRERYLKNLPAAGDVRAFTKSFVTPDVLRPIARAAEVSELADRGKIDEVLKGVPAGDQNAVIDNWLKAAKLAGVEKEVLNVKPDWAPRIGEKVEKIVPKIENIIKVGGDSFRSAAVVAALTKEQFEKLSREAGADVKSTIKQTIKEELAKVKKDLNLSNDEWDKLAHKTERELKKIATQQGTTIKQVEAARQQTIDQLQINKNISLEEIRRVQTLVSRRQENITNPSWQT